MQQTSGENQKALFEKELSILRKISLNEYHHANIMQVKELYAWSEET